MPQKATTSIIAKSGDGKEEKADLFRKYFEEWAGIGIPKF